MDEAAKYEETGLFPALFSTPYKDQGRLCSYYIQITALQNAPAKTCVGCVFTSRRVWGCGDCAELLPHSALHIVNVLGALKPTFRSVRHSLKLTFLAFSLSLNAQPE
jgi:hypothetical protein